MGENKFRAFMSEIAPYVVVVGSFARMEENEHSDIDCFLRTRPVEKIDPDKGNDTYMPEVLALIDRFGYRSISESVLIGHIAINRAKGVERMIEISSHYRIPVGSKVFYREIFGVSMMCAVDNKKESYDACYDALDWDDETMDNIIRNPLPVYCKEVQA